MQTTGLDQLTRTLNDAQKALQDLDGELGKVSFNVTDPASIEAAIQEMERIVDQRLEVAPIRWTGTGVNYRSGPH